MSMDIIYRGTLILFSVTFTDAAGVAAEPSTVTLNLNYWVAGTRRTTAAIAMTLNSGTFSAEWDSSVAYGGEVFWSVRTTAPLIANDGSFVLRANVANPNPS